MAQTPEERKAAKRRAVDAYQAARERITTMLPPGTIDLIRTYGAPPSRFAAQAIEEKLRELDAADEWMPTDSVEELRERLERLETDLPNLSKHALEKKATAEEDVVDIDDLIRGAIEAAEREGKRIGGDKRRLMAFSRLLRDR
ncbi:MAG: hypothetical protein IKD88_00900 [Lachnospiraceae bacterium]|nr:hypothetical protein [Lachnospiraceae bacterium]